MVQVGDGIDRDDFAVINDDDFAAGLFHFREDVGAEDDGVVAGEAGDQLTRFALLFGIETGGRLVENQNRRVVDDGLGDADALAVAFGKLADDGACGRCQDGGSDRSTSSTRLAMSAGWDALQLGDEGQVIGNLHLGVERAAFRAGSRCVS